MAVDMMKTAVLLKWYNKLDSRQEKLIASGFVSHRKPDFFVVLTTIKHVMNLFCPSGTTDTSSAFIGVKVTFYGMSESDELEGIVFGANVNMDMCGIKVDVKPDQMSSPPLCFVEPVRVAKEDPYQDQQIISIHNSTMMGAGNVNWSLASFQYTEGFIADENFQSSGKVHFSMPLIMKGSFGAPVFDRHSRRLVCMIGGAILGTSLQVGHTFPEQRLEAYPASKIIDYIVQVGGQPNY